MRPHLRRRLPKKKNRSCAGWMMTVRCRSSRLVHRRRLPKKKNRSCAGWMMTVRGQSSRLVHRRRLPKKKNRSCAGWMMTVRGQSSRLVHPQPGALHAPAHAARPRQQPRLGLLPSSSEPWRHCPPLRRASAPPIDDYQRHPVHPAACTASQQLQLYRTSTGLRPGAGG